MLVNAFSTLRSLVMMLLVKPGIYMVFNTQGEIPYKGGQSIGIITDGEDKNGKPHKLRLVYAYDQGVGVKGVCSDFLCDLKPGNDVQITGPVGEEMLMPKDPNATVIVLANGTGIAPFRSFLWKMFFEKHEDYKEFEKMKEKKPENFRLDFAVSREESNAKGEKMYIQT